MPVRNRYKVFIIDEVHQLSGPFVQRAAEVDRGAAAARRLHDGDDRAREDSGDGPVALAGLRVPDDRHEGDRRAAPQDRRRRRHHRRRRVAAAHRPRCRRQHARRAEQARSGDRVHREDDRRRGRVDRARPGRPRSAARRDPGRRDEDAAAAFEIAGRAVELGYDLRLVCRELSRVVRDLLVLSVDPTRIQDPEIAGEGERDRLKALAGRFSREDLLRAFDLLDARRRPTSRPPRSRAITSRWRCCAGFTCAS